MQGHYSLVPNDRTTLAFFRNLGWRLRCVEPHEAGAGRFLERFGRRIYLAEDEHALESAGFRRNLEQTRDVVLW